MSARTGTLYWLPLILDCADLSPTETLLLVALADHVNAEDECFVSIHTLAPRARVSYATARRKLTDLEERGYIARQRRRRGDKTFGVYDYALLRPAFGQPSAQIERWARSPRRALDARARARAQKYPSNPPMNTGASQMRSAPIRPVSEVLAERPPRDDALNLDAIARIRAGEEI